MDGKIFYVTKEKLKQLKKEHDDLVALEHNKLSLQEAPRMLESEDMNPEFVSYQEDMTTLRDKIDALKNVLDSHEIIKAPSKEQQHVVAVGAKVKIDIDGKHDEFTIMGTLDANPEAGVISNESPVGKALLGRQVGDQIEILAPHKTVYKIKNITYEIS